MSYSNDMRQIDWILSSVPLEYRDRIKISRDWMKYQHEGGHVTFHLCYRLRYVEGETEINIYELTGRELRWEFDHKILPRIQKLAAGNLTARTKENGL